MGILQPSWNLNWAGISISTCTIIFVFGGFFLSIWIWTKSCISPFKTWNDIIWHILVKHNISWSFWTSTSKCHRYITMPLSHFYQQFMVLCKFRFSVKFCTLNVSWKLIWGTLNLLSAIDWCWFLNLILKWVYFAHCAMYCISSCSNSSNLTFWILNYCSCHCIHSVLPSLHSVLPSLDSTLCWHSLQFYSNHPSAGDIVQVW